MIELSNILLKYGERVILEIPRLIFLPGKRYGLIGENGSGKSTLLRIMAGTLAPEQGSINGLEGQRVGYLPQAPYAFSFNVLKNVELALLDFPKDKRKAIAIEAIRRVGMQKFVRARGDRLSGGESQRMGLARVIALPRTLLLLDEPTSATDIRGMDQIEETLLGYQVETQCTIIFSTHSPAQALRLADEVIFLVDGRIEECGAAEQILKCPERESTQSFLRHWRL